MTPDLGIEPHWWEASALTTAPSLHPILLFKHMFNKYREIGKTVKTDGKITFKNW